MQGFQNLPRSPIHPLQLTVPYRTVQYCTARAEQYNGSAILPETQTPDTWQDFVEILDKKAGGGSSDGKFVLYHCARDRSASQPVGCVSYSGRLPKPWERKVGSMR